MNWTFFKMDFYKDCYNKKAFDKMHIKMISETLILEGPGRFYLDSWYINCASKIPIERGGGGIIIQLRKITPSKNDSFISHLNLRIQNVKALFLSLQFYPHRPWTRRELSSLRTTGFFVPCSAFSSAGLRINGVGALCWEWKLHSWLCLLSCLCLKPPVFPPVVQPWTSAFELNVPTRPAEWRTLVIDKKYLYSGVRSKNQTH